MNSLIPGLSLFYKEKKNLFFLVLGLFLLVLAASHSGQGGSSSIQSSLFPARSTNSQDLFLSAVVSTRDYPELGLIQNNSLVGASSPLLADPQVLAVKSEAELEEGMDREIREYVVREGDNLWSIADEFGISVDTILWANGMTDSTINPGQKLVILPVSGVMHIVEDGETLSEIAGVYEAELEEIIAFNNLSKDGKIYIGDILVVPGGEMPPYFQTYSVPLASSYFIFPCQGTITQGLHWYNAIDVGNDCGTPIFAAAEGQVVRTGWTKTGGNYVRILHPNGVVTYYGHLSKILVDAGQSVSQGAMIAYMGESGEESTGCHLHFDVVFAQNPLAKYPVGSYIGWE